MSMQLPEAFLTCMRELLRDDYPAFLASYDEERHFGLRANPLKLSPERLAEEGGMRLTPIPWCREGFYYGEAERPGKRPAYHAGLYYIQEPSAMLPVELLDVRSHDKVLDLCAAPGGKATQIAAKLNGEGLLVANDNHAERMKPLVKNIELFGVRNAIAVNETPQRLAARWPEFFDKILVDAPCSGEGMFRKEEDMIRQWERHSVERCAAMQREIMREAAKLVKPGGRIVYSTCTFSAEENEAVIAEFLALHPAFRVVPVPLLAGFAPGRPDWAAELRPDLAEAAPPLAGAVRLWPHRVKGEGHFAVVLERAAGEGEAPASSAWTQQPAGQPARLPRCREAGSGRAERGKERFDASDLQPWQQFSRELLADGLFAEAVPALYGETLYLVPPGAPPLDGLKVARPGLHAGTLRRGRFAPAPALALALKPEEAKSRLRLPGGSEAVIRYLKGETLPSDIAPLETRGGNFSSGKGYVLVCMDDYPLGWAKLADGWLKNEYPPAWRWI